MDLRAYCFGFHNQLLMFLFFLGFFLVVFFLDDVVDCRFFSRALNLRDRLPYLTTVKNGTATLQPAWNHLVQNFFFSGSPFSIDTDDGSDWLNVSSNVVYKQPLFKVDYGGHSKHFSNNVALYGAGCIHSNIAPRSPHGPEHCHYFSPCADKDPTTAFFGNQCIGSNTGIRCGWNCTPGVDCATVSNNKYYFPGGNGSAVCTTGALERGSTTAPMPEDEQALALAAATLGIKSRA